MGSKISVGWDAAKNPITLAKKVEKFDPRFKTVVAGMVSYHESVATTYMKDSAPWTDRTGNARSGLNAKANITEDYAELVLAHSVYYGIFLEVCNSGKYAVIGPAVDYIGKLLMIRLNGAIAKLEDAGAQ